MCICNAAIWDIVFKIKIFTNAEIAKRPGKKTMFLLPTLADITTPIQEGVCYNIF